MGAVSCYFQVDGNDVWNPSSSVARLFVDQGASLSRLLNVDSGIGEIVEDECRVDGPAFEGFTALLVAKYQEVNNAALRSLLSGFIPLALVLVQRTGGASHAIHPKDLALWHAALVHVERSMPPG
ncbi:DUF6086 family protein [Streptomyces sp. RKAG290]|uniref:DUF6086 family protein n=1 Tax=Streptomyces sp. RKAG290 TaxID=2888348 RepID=UPI0020335F9D|nr:DUF6086 family protein [Streptomyces sp. RKAG290]MCM2412806.1 DUF6086 family protein [Streptomyces sp. RKAG290]